MIEIFVITFETCTPHFRCISHRLNDIRVNLFFVYFLGQPLLVCCLLFLINARWIFLLSDEWKNEWILKLHYFPLWIWPVEMINASSENSKCIQYKEYISTFDRNWVTRAHVRCIMSSESQSPEISRETLRTSNNNVWSLFRLSIMSIWSMLQWATEAVVIICIVKVITMRWSTMFFRRCIIGSKERLASLCDFKTLENHHHHKTLWKCVLRLYGYILDVWMQLEIGGSEGDPRARHCLLRRMPLWLSMWLPKAPLCKTETSLRVFFYYTDDDWPSSMAYKGFTFKVLSCLSACLSGSKFWLRGWLTYHCKGEYKTTVRSISAWMLFIILLPAQYFCLTELCSLKN